MKISGSKKEILNQMSSKARAQVEKLYSYVGEGCKYQVLAEYDRGALLLNIESKPGYDRDKDPALVAKFFNIQNIRRVKRFAETFSRDLVVKYQSKPMANGEFLTKEHWIKLATIDDEGSRLGMLDQVIENSWSTRELDSVIIASGLKNADHPRAGGRPPSAPAGFAAGLTKLSKLASSIVNYIHSNLDSILDDLLESVSDLEDEEVNQIAVVSAGLLELSKLMKETSEKIESTLSDGRTSRKRGKDRNNRAEPRMKESGEVEDEVAEECDEDLDDEEEEEDEMDEFLMSKPRRTGVPDVVI